MCHEAYQPTQDMGALHLLVEPFYKALHSVEEVHAACDNVLSRRTGIHRKFSASFRAVEALSDSLNVDDTRTGVSFPLNLLPKSTFSDMRRQELPEVPWRASGSIGRGSVCQSPGTTTNSASVALAMRKLCNCGEPAPSAI